MPQSQNNAENLGFFEPHRVWIKLCRLEKKKEKEKRKEKGL